MNCLQSLPRSCRFPLQSLDSHERPFSSLNPGISRTVFRRKSAMKKSGLCLAITLRWECTNIYDFITQTAEELPLETHGIDHPVGSQSCWLRPSEIKSYVNVGRVGQKAYSASSTKTSGAEEKEDEKSELYSNNMTQAMGAVLTYRHELGMDYNYICPDLIVGSCLQTPADVDKLRKIGVKTIFCLQQDSDLEYFGVDISAIREYAKQYDDIQHLRAKIQDFNTFDLRMQLPAVMIKLLRAINSNGGVTYVHCTAGLGRAPTVMLAYMFWVQGYKLNEGHKLLQSKRACFPKLEAIKNATADILTGVGMKRVTLKWKGDNCSSVEISGLDVGWGQRIPLKFDKEKRQWVLERELPEGLYEYKYIVDGQWTCKMDELVTLPNKDGHVNNYINVVCSDSGDASGKLRKHLMDDDVDLTKEEQLKIRRFLEACPDDD